jgi:hypothetical protein
MSQRPTFKLVLGSRAENSDNSFPLIFLFEVADVVGDLEFHVSISEFMVDVNAICHKIFFGVFFDKLLPR